MKKFVTLLPLLALCHCSSQLRKPSGLGIDPQNFIIQESQQDPVACEAFIKTLPQGMRHGYVTSGDRKIFYYGKWRSRPIVIANGGPGISSWPTFKNLNKALDEHGVEYLFFDQRGTGCSSGYPALDEKSLSAWRDYGSRGMAEDIELMRARLHLGPKISVFGNSFGSKIALSYAIHFPASTHSVIIHGDSYVTSANQIVDAIAGTLQRQERFLSERLSNPQLQATLISLSKKYSDTPCARDKNNFISACGYTLIRDLAHYYTASTADKIEDLLFKLDDPKTEAEAFHDVVFNYTHWKLDPQSILLGYLDYVTFVNGQLACDLALNKLTIPDWHLNSCVIVKHRLDFLTRIKRVIPQELVTFDLVEGVLFQHPDIHVYSFESQTDLNNNDIGQRMSLPNWTYVNLKGSDHYDYHHSEDFWAIVKKATAPL